MMKALLLLTMWLFTVQSSAAPDGQHVTTHITLDGLPTAAYFNDGDTFKILDGKLKDTRVRVEGFNALENYGPVHEWQENKLDYLFDIAKRANAAAKAGSWHCESQGGLDTYGRLLAVCDDLALALISEGLAHAYSVDNNPAVPHYLVAQKAAQTNRLGMWKHGVPNFIITSLHSANEGDGDNYNRLISTADGHSEKWRHQKNYATCEKVCLQNEASCMVYVPFAQRYGSSRPACLR